MNYLKDKRVLVTGGAGFVATNILLRLLKDKDVSYIRATYHIQQPQIENNKIDFVQVDLTNSDDVDNITKDIDIVFHCAAFSKGALYLEQKPNSMLTPNIIMNALLLDKSYKNGVKKFVLLSSNTVYPDKEFPMKEIDVDGTYFDKYFMVASMKRYSEIMCEAYATKISPKMRTLVIRPANLYGPYDDFDPVTSHVLPAFIRRVVNRENPMKVWGTLENEKDFLFIDDFIDGLMLAVNFDKSDFEIFNLSSNFGYQLKDLLKMMLEIENFINAQIEFDLSKPDMIKKRVVDNSKAKEILGWIPKIDIKEALKKTIDWYKENR